MQYLNDLYRARAEKAGIIYVDVWDGFVDESGHFTLQGPDFEGQMRRLRTGDGVHFTKAGARKLAHYRRARNPPRDGCRGSQPVALPSSEPLAPAAAARPSGPTARPLAGPVVPLTASAAAGAGPARRQRSRRAVGAEVRDPRAGEGRGGRAAGRPRRRFHLAAPRRSHRSAPIRWSPPPREPLPVMQPAPATTVAAPQRGGSPGRRGQPLRVRRSTTGRAPAPPQQQQWQQNSDPFSFFSFGR